MKIFYPLYTSVTDFTKHGPENASWNVVRSEFDEMLLRNAQKAGVRVFEGTKATAIQFEHGDDGRMEFKSKVIK